jgi:hypothetical protein
MISWKDMDHLLQPGILQNLFWVVTGTILGWFADRVWLRIESKPRFRIQVGYFQNVMGSGLSLTITNAGFDPLPEYEVELFHPKRGILKVFHGERKQTVFPQYPEQWNQFDCFTGPLPKPPPGWTAAPQLNGMVEFVRDWFLNLRGTRVSAPAFSDFEFRLVLKNSELVLFQDGELGNSLAKQLFERVSGQPVEQEVKEVFYKSKAPFWVEWIRDIKIRRELRKLKRGGK